MNKFKLLKSMVQKHMLQNERIENQLVILKNTPIAKRSTQKPLSLALLFHNDILLPAFTHKTCIHNKNYEVIVKINDPNSA